MSKFRSIPYAVLSGSLLVGGGAYAQSMYHRSAPGLPAGPHRARHPRRADHPQRGLSPGAGRAGDRSCTGRARADGLVTPQERARIDRMTDREGRESTSRATIASSPGIVARAGVTPMAAMTAGATGAARTAGAAAMPMAATGAAMAAATVTMAATASARRTRQRPRRLRTRDGDRHDDHTAWNGQPATARTTAERRLANQQGSNSRRTTGTQPASGTHSWGNMAAGSGSQAGNTPRRADDRHAADRRLAHWGNGGWQHAPQAGGTAPTTPSTGTQPASGSRSWGNGGYRMQQAAATPQQQAPAPRPTYDTFSSPCPSPSAGAAASADAAKRLA